MSRKTNNNWRDSKGRDTGRSWRDRRTFGPAVYSEPDGSFRPVCTWCVFRVGTKCTDGTWGNYPEEEKERPIPNPENTPDWCKYREGMLKDTREAVALAGEIKQC